MKREILEFISKCLVCQQVIVEHQQPAGLLQPLHLSVEIRACYNGFR